MIMVLKDEQSEVGIHQADLRIVERGGSAVASAPALITVPHAGQSLQIQTASGKVERRIPLVRLTADPSGAIHFEAELEPAGRPWFGCGVSSDFQWPWAVLAIGALAFIGYVAYAVEFQPEYLLGAVGYLVRWPIIILFWAGYIWFCVRVVAPRCQYGSPAAVFFTSLSAGLSLMLSVAWWLVTEPAAPLEAFPHDFAARAELVWQRVTTSSSIKF